MNHKEAAEFIQREIDTNALPSLMDYVRIPNLSRVFYTDPACPHQLQAALFLKAWVEGQALKQASIQVHQDPGFSPYLLTEVKSESEFTVLLYGHFDKQPPMTGWREGLGPYKPVIQGDYLFGRGAADDGYATYACILAIKSAQQQGVPLPRLFVLIQGDQESSSLHLKHYLPRLKERFGRLDLCICLDSSSADYDTLWVTNSIRGLVNFNMTVKVADNGIHSGDSGTRPSSFRICRMLLSRLEDQQTGRMHQALQYPIEPVRYKEACDFVEYKQDAFSHISPLVTQDRLQLLLNKAFRPQLQIIGCDGIPSPSSASNLLRAYTTLTVSIRLPPKKSAPQVEKFLRTTLQQQVPYGARVSLQFSKVNTGWSNPPFSKKLEQALTETSQKVFGKKYQAIHEGGSIAFLGMLFNEYPELQFAVMGVLGQGSCEHAADQRLYIPIFKKITLALAILLSTLSK